ncbi:hypothetical protein FPQ18DRAFT_419646 [Pyronema domesticum]|nr:hypothetical protein FPQ18DRAFT_419646 [Pyronema domesticum]
MQIKKALLLALTTFTLLQDADALEQRRARAYLVAHRDYISDLEAAQDRRSCSLTLATPHRLRLHPPPPTTQLIPLAFLQEKYGGNATMLSRRALNKKKVVRQKRLPEQKNVVEAAEGKVPKTAPKTQKKNT